MSHCRFGVDKMFELLAGVLIGETRRQQSAQEAAMPAAVSYTHLTLPTILRV